MPQDTARPANSILTEEQEELLDAYLQKLDDIQEQLKLAEKVQVAIETEHLKRILSR
ncbi:hypothetical protein [Pontibacter oryzae]|uniref:hypothetical protein n=1 Tax=Pontibacter oryzae TaxID=2304593 RepID=UPI0018F61D94|nr:hypothetical protein [Pontibacter oryzae]